MLKSLVININACPNTLSNAYLWIHDSIFPMFIPTCLSSPFCPVPSFCRPFVPIFTRFQNRWDSGLNCSGAPIIGLQKIGIIRKIILKKVEHPEVWEWDNILIELCKCQYTCIPLKSQSTVHFRFGISLQNFIFSGWKIQLSGSFVISQLPYLCKSICLDFYVFQTNIQLINLKNVMVHFFFEHPVDYTYKWQVLKFFISF